MVTASWDVNALEVNTTPGMSRDSNFVVGARLCGLRGCRVAGCERGVTGHSGRRA